MKKTSSLPRKCDQLCAQVVKLRDKGKCRICGNSGQDSHHIIPRGYAGTMYLVENRLLVCRKCHELPDLKAKCIGIIGQNEYDRLRNIAEWITHLYESDLIIIRDELERELKRLKLVT
jgi:hypothetical protein